MCQSTVKLEHNSMRECTQNMSTKQINVLKKLKKTDQKNKKKLKVSNCEIYL